MLTFRVNSSDGNGYRIGLHDHLAGSKLLFVGDRIAGTMANNENAGTFLRFRCCLCLNSIVILSVLGGNSWRYSYLVKQAAGVDPTV